MPGSRAQQKEQTRRALVGQARGLFAERGYAAVGLPEVVAAAGVTKGALYHHFDGKAALFAAVLDEVQQEVGRTVAAAADAEPDPWDGFTAGCQAFLTAATAPGVRRILLVDGPAVLGWDVWREMDGRASARHLADALAELIAAGEVAAQPVAPLARLLSGAMNEAALWLAQSQDPAEPAATRGALGGLLEALRVR